MDIGIDIVIKVSFYKDICFFYWIVLYFICMYKSFKVDNIFIIFFFWKWERGIGLFKFWISRIENVLNFKNV